MKPTILSLVVLPLVVNVACSSDDSDEPGGANSRGSTASTTTTTTPAAGRSSNPQGGVAGTRTSSSGAAGNATVSVGSAGQLSTGGSEAMGGGPAAAAGCGSSAARCGEGGATTNTATSQLVGGTSSSASTQQTLGGTNTSGGTSENVGGTSATAGTHSTGAQNFGGNSSTGGVGPTNAGGGTNAGGSGGASGAHAGGSVATGSSTAGAGGSGVTIHAGAAGVAGTETIFAEAGTAGTAGVAGASPIQLSVKTDSDVHTISPLIYGIVSDTVDCANSAARFTLCRLGGNRWSTYNWENNASNAGNLTCFQNDGALGESNVPADTVTALITKAHQQAATSVVTIPIIDYVAADKVGGTPPPLCSGDVRLDTNYLTTRFKHNQARKGSSFADPPDATDGNVSQDEFLHYVKARSGSANVVITLDNQPELWSQTHQPVHPDHATYQEVVERNVQYAAMVRDNWPGAEITGYGGYGYYAFLNLQDAPNPPGNSEFLDYYLAAMQAAEVTAQRRLVDYLDIHWYSEAVGDGQRVISPDATSPLAAEARMQAPRSLWDSTYSENSWISGSVGPIRLIPWLKDKISRFYPGTKLAISEWSYGGEGTISGAIAVADALGIYGRDGVDLAALQPLGSDMRYALAGFSSFRNFDGNGSEFGDTSVRATSSDVSKVSVYASVSSNASNRVVVVAINRSATSLDANLRVDSATAFTSADVYRLTNAAPTLVRATSLVSTGASSFVDTLPAQSVSVIMPKP